MRIRRPRLHPPASKSKAFAKVVTFHREDAEKTEKMQGTEEQTDRRAGREEGDSEEMERREEERGGGEKEEEEKSGMGRYANVSLRESRRNG